MVQYSVLFRSLVMVLFITTVMSYFKFYQNLYFQLVENNPFTDIGFAIIFNMNSTCPIADFVLNDVERYRPIDLYYSF